MATKQKSEILTIVAVCLMAVAMIGCQPPWVDKIGSDMDKIAKGYEKFGTVSMSYPILVQARQEPNNGGYFDFNLPACPNEYYKDALAKTQGQSAIFDQFAETSGFGLNVQMNLIAMMGYNACLNDYNLPPIKNIAPDANNAQRVLNGANFTKFLGLLEGNSTPSISNRSAITTAAGDTVTEGIFRLLGNPAEAMKCEDKLIMFGVSMVSVNPGWLTNKNYTAELAVACRYSYKPARRELLIKLLENEEDKAGRMKDANLIKLINYALYETPIDINRIDVDENDKGEKTYKIKDDFVPQRLQKKFREDCTPLAAAVSPMTDVDALNLASSQRIQVSEAIRIAAALSYLGSQAQSEFIKEWVKRREQDVRTRTAYAAVTAFSNGGFFGWRIRPRLKAIENPASIDSKPDNVLEQQAFPIVVIVGIDTDELQLGFDVEQDSNDQPIYTNGKTKIVAFEPLIRFRQTVSWLPNKSTESIWNPVNRLSETERLRWAYSRMKATENLGSAKIDNDEVIKFIKNRGLLLGCHTLDSWNEQCIPLDLMVKDPNTK